MFMISNARLVRRVGCKQGIIELVDVGGTISAQRRGQKVLSCGLERGLIDAHTRH
jgi:hypothetical protein